MVSETKTTEAPTLRRELKARHLTMIAIGGFIGKGVFVGSGATLLPAGPRGGLLCFFLFVFLVFFFFTPRAELAGFLTVSG
ncbi:lysine transporter, partial [Pseudomonas aeruginosa]|nr:lysine transporter [Pseudomonas aeruginosa]